MVDGVVLRAVMSMPVWKGVDATVCIIATRHYSRKGKKCFIELWLGLTMPFVM